MEIAPRSSGHHHAAWLPGGHRRHLIGAFILLLIDRDVRTVDEICAALDRLRVARGRVERAEVERLVTELSTAGLLVERHGLRPTHDGSALVVEWAEIMRDRRRLARSFLQLYDEVT